MSQPKGLSFEHCQVRGFEEFFDGIEALHGVGILLLC